MSLENAIQFGQLAMGDETIRNELFGLIQGKSESEAAEAAAEFVTGRGYPCTAEEAIAGYHHVLRSTDANDELSDAELEAVAGGTTDGKPDGRVDDGGMSQAAHTGQSLHTKYPTPVPAGLKI